jgi:serine protease Do
MSDQNNPTIVLIRHIAGSKKGQTEKFTVTNDLDIRIGRGPDNNVSFDPVKEDTISREHCRIRRNIMAPDTYELIDSQSRNGTFVNDKKITEKTVIFAGDIISLGKEGPSMEFDLDPRPASHVKKTRVLDIAKEAKETKAHAAVASISTSATGQKPVQKDSIGKQTMQHMIQQSEKKSRKGLLVSLIAIVILVGTGGWLLFNRKPIIIPSPPPVVKDSVKTVNPAQIAKANENKVVYIEAGWKLVVTQTGDQLYHVYLPVKSGGIVSYMASYIRNNVGVVEPYLVTKSSAPLDSRLEPIGGFGSGSGFVVDERGFIVTNRHVAASWLTSYSFPDNAFPGVLLEPDSHWDLVINKYTTIYRESVPAWVPAEAMNYNRQLLQSGVKIIDGELAYMDVTFANNSLRTPSKVVRISNTHDVAMIKIDLPEELNKVSMYDNYKEIEPGSPVVVMGYPGMSPDQFVANRSQDAFNRNPNIVKVPVPTISSGIVGRLVKGSAGSSKVDEYLSMMGDYYQLTINSTGAGNSGGPMFDDQGRVIGIYSAASDKMSYSIPIKYAIELMGRQEVIK